MNKAMSCSLEFRTQVSVIWRRQVNEQDRMSRSLPYVLRRRHRLSGKRLSEGGFTSQQLAGEYKASEKLYIFVHKVLHGAPIETATYLKGVQPYHDFLVPGAV